MARAEPQHTAVSCHASPTDVMSPQADAEVKQWLWVHLVARLELHRLCLGLLFSRGAYL